jgi:hypothetical protein
MPNKDRKAPLMTSQRLIAVGLGVSLLLVASLAAIVVREEDNTGVTDATLSSPSSEATAPTTESNTRAVVVERLKDILRIRDQAFRDHNSGILEDIYTVDCPCLEGDRNAIEELDSNNYHIVGGATSIRVRRVEQVSERLWLVIADFRSTRLRIEAEDGKVIREEAAGNDLYQFALSKPAGSAEWLLGKATAYREGSG